MPTAAVFSHESSCYLPVLGNSIQLTAATSAGLDSGTCDNCTGTTQDLPIQSGPCQDDSHDAPFPNASNGLPTESPSTPTLFIQGQIETNPASWIGGPPQQIGQCKLRTNLDDFNAVIVLKNSQLRFPLSESSTKNRMPYKLMNSFQSPSQPGATPV